MQAIFKFITSLLLAGLFFNAFASETKEEKKRLARLTYENMSINSEVALSYARKLETLAKAERDTTYIKYALNVQGIIYNRHLNYAAALRVLEEAIAVDENDADIIFNLANTHGLAGSEERALYLYDKALAIDSANINLVYSQTAHLHLDKDRPDVAKEFFTKELKVCRNSMDSLIAFTDLAFYYLEQQDLPNAKKHLELAQEKQATINSGHDNVKYAVTALEANLGQYYILKEKPEQAERYFRQAMESAEKLQLGIILRECYLGLQKVSVYKGDQALFDTYSAKDQALHLQHKKQLVDYYEWLVSNQEKGIDEVKSRIADTQENNRSQSYLIIGITFAVILLLVLAFSLFVRLRRKHHQQISRQQEELHELQQKVKQKDDQLFNLDFKVQEFRYKFMDEVDKVDLLLRNNYTLTKLYDQDHQGQNGREKKDNTED